MVCQYRNVNKNGIVPENPVLPTGLVGSGFQKLPWPVGGYQDQRNMAVPGLHDCRKQVPRGSAGGGNDCHRSQKSQGHSQCQESQVSLIEMHVIAE